MVQTLLNPLPWSVWWVTRANPEGLAAPVMSRDKELGYLGAWDHILPAHFGKSLTKAANDNTKKSEKKQTLGRIPILKPFLCTYKIPMTYKNKIFKHRVNLK